MRSFGAPIIKISANLAAAMALVGCQTGNLVPKTSDSEFIALGDFVSLSDLEKKHYTIAKQDNNLLYFVGDVGGQLTQCSDHLYEICIISEEAELYFVKPTKILPGQTWTRNGVIFRVMGLFGISSAIDARVRDNEVFRVIYSGDSIVGFAWGKYLAEADNETRFLPAQSYLWISETSFPGN